MLHWRRLRFFRGRRDERADIEKELRFHIEGRARELEAAGYGKEEAEREAARVFGNYWDVRDACVAVAGHTPTKREHSMTLESIRSDIAFAVRGLWKNPGFAAVALITLALGIGANTAIFTVVNAVLLRDLPYHEPDRLAMIWLDNQIQGWLEDVTSYPNYVDLRERNRTLEEVAAYRRTAITLTGEVAPQRLAAAAVTHTFFPVLGVSPFMGRWFTEEEDQRGNERVVVLAEGFWRNRFGGDESMVGKSIVLDDQSYTVVGVMPASFDHPAGMALWMPMAPNEQIRSCRLCLHLAQIARMKPGVTLEDVRLDLAGVARLLAEDYPESNTRMGFTVNPLLDQLVRDVRTALWVLVGTVGFVLLIACANIANLLLARGAARESEVAVRVALGASRGRLFRQLLTESLVLATIGVPLGILVARVGISAMSVAGSSGLPRMGEVSMSGEVMLFTAVVGVFAAVVFGLMPAIQSSRLDVNAHLKEGGRSGGRHRHMLRRGLVIAEVALTFMLLVGGGLLMRSFARLQDEDIGLSTDNLITLSLSATGSKYQAPASVLAFFADLQESLRALPSVTRVGASTERATGGSAPGAPFIVEGKDLFTRDSYIEVRQNRATPDFFHTAGIPVISGRTFDEFDRDGAESVVLISESMARRFWPGEDPVGSRIAYGLDAGENANWRTVVGVVGDVRASGLVTEIQPATFMPLQQAPTRRLTFVIRTETEPADLFSSIRRAVWDIDPNMPIPTLTTMDDVVANRIRARRFNTILLAMFAGVALALAVAGVYGVMSYTVSQWTHDIGLRLALGAQRADVLKMVVADGAKMAGIGLAVGLAGAIALSRLMSGMLFGVTPFDPATLVMAALVLGMTALMASYLPALRATRIDSLSALRCD